MVANVRHIMNRHERQKSEKWRSIIKQMKDFGLDIEKFPVWPSNNTILFENRVLRLKVIGTTGYCVEFL
jgi:3-dehydroquinate dehydratase